MQGLVITSTNFENPQNASLSCTVWVPAASCSKSSLIRHARCFFKLLTQENEATCWITAIMCIFVPHKEIKVACIEDTLLGPSNNLVLYFRLRDSIQLKTTLSSLMADQEFHLGWPHYQNRRAASLKGRHIFAQTYLYLVWAGDLYACSVSCPDAYDWWATSRSLLSLLMFKQQWTWQPLKWKTLLYKVEHVDTLILAWAPTLLPLYQQT